MQKLARELFFSQLPADDLGKAEIQDSMRSDCFGIALDLRIRCMDWGFCLSELKPKVIMRHSRADQSVPFVTAEMTARLLPNCHLEVRELDEHFSQAVLDDFLDTLVVGRTA
jgi:hypothetical protein